MYVKCDLILHLIWLILRIFDQIIENQGMNLGIVKQQRIFFRR